MKVLLVTPFVDPVQDDSGRSYKLIQTLEQQNISHQMITTTFNHAKKRLHDTSLCSKEIHFIKVPEYIGNLSIRRFYSHTVFAIKLLIYLFKNSSLSNVDAIYASAPTSLSALACIIFAKINKIKVCVDVIDLWPNSFHVLLPAPKITGVLLVPWYITSYLVYWLADKLFTESIAYQKYTQKFSSKKVEYVNLGVDNNLTLEIISSNQYELDKKPDIFYLCYGGSLGKSYDFDVILQALISLKRQNINNWEFIFIGDGEQRKHIEKLATEYSLPVRITGYLPYADFIKCLSQCDIGLNSFKRNTKIVYSYKFNDYLSVGLCVLNNLQGETFDIVNERQIGLNFDYEESSLAKQLTQLLDDEKKIDLFKKNSLIYSQTQLEYADIYQKFIRFFRSNK